MYESQYFLEEVTHHHSYSSLLWAGGIWCMLSMVRDTLNPTWWISSPLKMGFRSEPSSHSHLTEPIIGHVSGNLTWSIYLPIRPESHQSPDSPPVPHGAPAASVRSPLAVCLCCWRRTVTWAFVRWCRLCLALTPTVLADTVCYLSRRRSWLLVDIWKAAEASQCETWINTGKAPCPTLTFAWAGKVRRPNTMLLRRYYLYYL